MAASSGVGLAAAIIHTPDEKYAGSGRPLLATAVSLMRMPRGHGIALWENSNASQYTSHA
eukprot:2370130-Alexandrium_andersonii.AAC.1